MENEKARRKEILVDLLHANLSAQDLYYFTNQIMVDFDFVSYGTVAYWSTLDADALLDTAEEFVDAEV